MSDRDELVLLLNRIDEIIVFRSLDRDQLMQITRLLLDRAPGECVPRTWT